MPPGDPEQGSLGICILTTRNVECVLGGGVCWRALFVQGAF